MEEEVIRIPISQRGENEDHGVNEYVDTLKNKHNMSQEAIRDIDKENKEFNKIREKAGLPPWPYGHGGDKRQALFMDEIGKTTSAPNTTITKGLLFAPTREEMERAKMERDLIMQYPMTPDEAYKVEDKINPTYYNGDECLQAIIGATVNKTGAEGFLVGNIIKYLWRCESKGGAEDVKKAEWYLTKLIEEMNKRKG